MRDPHGAPLVRAASCFAMALATMVSCSISVGGDRPDQEVPPRSDAIVIGAFNFSESRVLAEVYRQALESRGFPSDVLSDVGPREVIEPALEQDQIDIAIEYLGAALAFLDPEALEGVTDPRVAYSLLEDAFGAKGVRTLTPAPGENRNEFVVTTATAEEFDLEKLSDLQKVDSDFVFGGPPECTARPLCLEGLNKTYQLEFASFIPLDSGGPQTVAALETGEVDVALLFTTNPAITEDRLIALKDDRRLQPPENILPVVRDDVADSHGDALVETIDAVTERLTTEDLRELNAEIEISQKAPEDVAEQWLKEQGLT